MYSLNIRLSKSLWIKASAKCINVKCKWHKKKYAYCKNSMLLSHCEHISNYNSNKYAKI